MMAKKQVTFGQAMFTVNDWLDVLVRATKTAVQVFIASVPVNVLMSGDADVIKSAVIAAVSAGLSVVWNSVALWAASPTTKKG